MHQIYTWQTASGKKIFGQSWVPASLPQAVICLIHGQGEHSSRYAPVADFFNANGFAVVTCDLIGHGKSDGARGHIQKFSDYLENTKMVLVEAKKMFPGIPVFLYGHSMGGNIVLNFLRSHSDDVTGCISTSPWIRLAFDPPKWKIILGKIVKSVLPGLLQPTGLDASAISHNTAEVEKYKNDPLNHSKISAAAYFEILENGDAILLHTDELKKPVLLMHGSGDKLTSHLASRELAEKRKDIITYKEFNGLYHELHHEFEKNEVLQTILTWIQKQL